MPESGLAIYQRLIGRLMEIRLGEDNDTRQVVPQHSSSCSNQCGQVETERGGASTI
jgi:hypothetical protein